MRIVVFFVLVATLMLSSAALAAEEVVVAKVGDDKITLDDLKRIMSYYDADRQKLLELNPQFKVTILQRIVQGKVLARLAREKGLDKERDIKEQIDLLANDFLANEYIKKEIGTKVDLTEEDLQIYYKAHQDEFRTPESVRARHVLVRVDRGASEDQKKKARDKANEILTKAKGGEDFAKLASEFSEDPGSKPNGGDLGFFQKGKMVPEFEKASFALKPGEVSGVVETQFGYHIIKVEEKKDSAVEPYDKVKDKVRDKAANEYRKAKAEEIVNKAMADAKAEVFADALMPKK